MFRDSIVYKYRKIDFKLEDILKNNRFYFSSPESFNDPFDTSIVPSVEIPDEDLKSWYEETRTKLTFTPEQRKEVDRVLESGEYKGEKFKKSVLAGIQNGLKEHGVISFSQRNENILLWSHYGDNHCGVAVGVEVQKLQGDDRYLVEAHYSSEFPRINLNETKMYQELMKRKYLCWEYEKEVRVIHRTGAGTYLDLGNDSIKEIIFGLKCTPDQIRDVIGWINWEKMNPVIGKASPKKHKYELDFVEIKDVPRMGRGEPR